MQTSDAGARPNRRQEFLPGFSCRKSQQSFVKMNIMKALTLALCAGLSHTLPAATPPALDKLPDNTWLRMAPAFEPAGLDFNGFGHPKTESKLVFDEKDHVVVWFGGCSNGYTNSTWLYSIADNKRTRANDLTYLRDGVEQEGPMTWTAKDCNSLPYGQCHYSITYDSDAGGCIKHTGIDSGWGKPDQNTWSYDAGLRKWTKLAAMPAGNVSIQALGYDRDNHKTILFGNLSGYGGADGNGTYAFDITTKAWTNRRPAASPSPRGWASFAYHQKLRKFVLFGGGSGGGPVKNATWLYDYAANTWTQIHPDTPPPARTRAGMVYDSHNDVMILTCGNDTHYGAGYQRRNVKPIKPSIPLHPRIRDVGEGDAHGCGVAALLHAAIVDHLAAVASAQLVEGGIESSVLFGVGICRYRRTS